jgi:hypothetical protein
MRRCNDRQKLHKRDGLWGGQERPGTETPMGTPHSSKIDGPCCIRRDEQVGKLGYARRQEEADAIPIMKESEPPVDIPTKLDVKANWVRAIAPEDQSYGAKTFSPDGQLCTLGGGGQSRTLIPDGDKYACWTKTGGVTCNG